jgi:hypothetical protein
MFLHDAVRARAERLMARNANPHDVDLLVADLRFMKGVHPLIVEVGNFAAHRGLRDVGEVQRVGTALHHSLTAHLVGRGGFTATGAFDDNDLAKAFKATLLNAGILPSHRLTSLKLLRAPLAMHAICAMHGTSVALDDGIVATLSLRGDPPGHSLTIGAYFPIAHPKQAFVHLPILTTSLTPEESCEGRLRAVLCSPQPVTDHTLTIERSAQGLLRYLE